MTRHDGEWRDVLEVQPSALPLQSLIQFPAMLPLLAGFTVTYLVPHPCGIRHTAMWKAALVGWLVIMVDVVVDVVLGSGAGKEVG